MVRLTDCPDMTLDVFRGRQTTTTKIFLEKRQGAFESFSVCLVEMCHQMITVLLDSVDNKTVYEFGRVMEIFRKFGHVMDSSFYLELNDEEADEVLKQASKNIPSQQNNVVTDHQYTFMEDDRHSPSPPKMGFVGPIIK